MAAKAKQHVDSCDLCADEVDPSGLEWCSRCGRMVCPVCMNSDTNRCKRCDGSED